MPSRKKNSGRPQYRFAMLPIAVCMLLIACVGSDRNGAGENNSENDSAAGFSTATVQGTLSTVADDATSYEVFNANQRVTPTKAGRFAIRVGKDAPTYTYAISSSKGTVYAAISPYANGAMQLNAESTAEAVVLMHPLLVPDTSAARITVTNIERNDPSAHSLALMIETVYASSADPLSDARISTALLAAIRSVLSTWQSTIVTATHVTPLQQKFRITFVRAAAASASPL